MEKNVVPAKFIIILSLFLLSIIFLVNAFSKKGTPFSFEQKKNIPTGPTIEEKAENQSFIAVPNTNPIEGLAENTLSYSDVVMLYGDKRIQFDNDCKATPSNASFPLGTIVVLDNRGNSVKAIKFVDDTYAIPPLHVKLVELNREGIFSVDCGTSKNVVRLNVN